MERWHPAVIGAVAGIMLLGVPFAIFRGEKDDGSVATAMSGVFGFTRPVERPPEKPAIARPHVPKRPPPPPSVDLETLERQEQAGQPLVAADVNRAPPAEALMMIEQRRRDVHDAREEAELDELAARAFDRLWWQRIGALMAERDAANQQQAALRVDYARARDPAVRASVDGKLQEAARQAENADAQLQAMGYSGIQPPDQAGEQQLQFMRQQRNPSIYAAWRQGVMRSLLRTQGRDPWGGT